MQFSIRFLNRYLLWKLPSAYFTGIRVAVIDERKVVTRVKHRWINQNPFRSLYFGVQVMAAELSTGILVMRSIYQSQVIVSMLVTEQKAKFTKKAVGIISFTCESGQEINDAVARTIATGEGEVLLLQSVGKDEKGDVVAVCEFQWSIKKKLKVKS